MPYENVLLQYEDDLAVITLNRPAKRNALSLQLMRELIHCLDEVESARSASVVILAAAGKVFSSGHDLGEMVGRDVSAYREIFDVCSQLMLRLQSISQPVIAEVQGTATAAGCQLVATCDLAIASEQATFATPGVVQNKPMRTPGVANVACSDAMARSQVATS
jgi:enoyl-CoA hydratase/carnithine racemase